MKWLDNLTNLSEHGTVGPCPYCKSKNTHHGYESIKNSEYGYGAIWCGDCNHGMYLCRVKMKDVVDMGEPIPKGLI